MVITGAIAALSFLMITQGIISIYWMLYAWEDAEGIEKAAPPKTFITPKHSFSAIIPARNEVRVIADTIKAIANINYPEELKEIIVVCRHDDLSTITVVNEVIRSIKGKDIKLVVFDDIPINKPHSLNIGLENATKSTIVVFDAEDQPHKDIYNIVNTISSLC